MIKNTCGVLSLMMLLGACGGERIVSSTDSRALRAGQRADLVNTRDVVVAGRPPDGSTAEDLAALLRFPGLRNDRPFQVVDAPGQGGRLVFTFGPAGNNACTAPRGQSTALPLVMTLTYCNNQSPEVTATLRSDTLTGPSDPGFARALDRLMQTISRHERRNAAD